MWCFNATPGLYLKGINSCMQKERTNLVNHVKTKKTNRSKKYMILWATVNLFSDLGRGFMVANVRLLLGLKRALW